MPPWGRARSDAQPGPRRGLHRQRVAVLRVLGHRRHVPAHRERDGLLPGRLRCAAHGPLRESISGRVRRRRDQVNACPRPDPIVHVVVRYPFLTRARSDAQRGRRRGFHRQRVAAQRVLGHRRHGPIHRERDGLLPVRLRRAVHRPLREGIPRRVRGRGLEIHARPAGDAGFREVRRAALARARTYHDAGRRRGFHFSVKPMFAVYCATAATAPSITNATDFCPGACAAPLASIARRCSRPGPRPGPGDSQSSHCRRRSSRSSSCRSGPCSN